ncbi:MAG: hypothetical protein ACREKI_05155 [Gemmatimonadota bacterium]
MLNRVNRRLKPPMELDARLRAVLAELGATAVDQVWIFTALPHQDPASEFVLLSCYDGAADRRRVVVARLCLEPLADDAHEVRWVQRLEAHGTAPRDAIPRLAERLSRRAGDPTAPVVGEIGGVPDRWEAFLRDLLRTEPNGNGHISGNGGVAR